MIIAYVRLSSDIYGANDELLITDKKVEEGNIEPFEIPHNTPLADKIFESVVSNSNTFHCNDTTYQILSYVPENKKIERRFNKYRSDSKFIPPINLIKNKKIIIYVVNGLTACENKHKSITLRAKVLTSDKKEVIIEINRCNNCGIYFIRYSQLMIYHKKFNGLCMNISTKYMSLGSNNNDWGRTQSELKILGYSVSKQEGLSTAQRRKILCYAIDNQIMGLTKTKIIAHLCNLIERAPYNPNWYDAESLWEQDLKFVSEYKSEQEILYDNGELKWKYQK